MTRRIGEIHHLSWKPLGEHVIQLLGLGPSCHHLTSPGSYRSCGDLSPPCFLRLGARGATPACLGLPWRGFRTAGVFWRASCLATASSSRWVFTGAFCCQFLTGGLRYQWTSREIAPNCPATVSLTCEGGFPVLEHVQIIEALLLWNKVTG